MSFIDCFFDWLDGKDIDPIDCLLDHGFDDHPRPRKEDDRPRPEDDEKDDDDRSDDRP